MQTLTDPAESPADPSSGDARAEIEVLRDRLEETRRTAAEKLTRAHLELHAVRAGMVDLDGLQFLNLADATLDEQGRVQNGEALIEGLAQRKPWLFKDSSSSSIARVPRSRPDGPRLATEMTDEEYRVARARILRAAR